MTGKASTTTSRRSAQKSIQPPSRYGLVSRPAAFATVALFVMMDRVIGMDEVQLGERPRITLPDIRPAAPDPEAPRSTRDPVERTETLKPPPPPARRLDSVFARSAEEAVRKVFFAPEPRNGQPMARRCVVCPFDDVLVAQILTTAC